MLAEGIQHAWRRGKERRWGNGSATAAILPLYQTTMKELLVDAPALQRMPFAMIGAPK
jgi:hypothetical protein